MITRYALFEGQVLPGKTDAFRKAVIENLVPIWKRFPGAIDVRFCFSDKRDEGAPSLPMFLAVNSADEAAVEVALNSAVRTEARTATEEILAKYFDGRIHHHLSEAHEFHL
ncbi:hypothetical protein ACQKGC_21960 [Allorhizobium pseudoryzae]|uniref:hypothetical protein n=1 Tax=Allorhizobium pseudoryzae TaxID=379684 RepID=UPI003D080F2A